MMREVNKEGIMLVNKPQGMTSHDVVDVVREKLKMQKVGHAGTLDPLAQGLLVILVGNSTKLFSKFVNFDKEYTGILKLGEVTTTGDSQGQVIKQVDCGYVTPEMLAVVLPAFKGRIEQIPPMVSALRVGVKRLYRLARKGIVVERKARTIQIYSLELLRVDLPFVEFYVHCSKGTYVRKLAEDIGDKIGCGGHMTKINRLSIGPFKLGEAVNLEDINESHLRKFTL